MALSITLRVSPRGQARARARRQPYQRNSSMAFRFDRTGALVRTLFARQRRRGLYLRLMRAVVSY